MSSSTQRVTKAFLQAINQFEMLNNTNTVVVGFSGGADSVCLLHLLSVYSEQFGYKVIAAHINHGIRGDEALRDEEFAKEFCQKHSIEFHLLKADCIAEANKTKETVEECGRRIRYAFFDSLCKDAFCKIATAHNANDNAETLIFNISRGTSLKGASGIPPVRDNIIRPVILCSREDIEGYCNENNLQFVTDSTNLNDDYTRNNIRHNVLPVLSKINPSFLTSISAFCEDISLADTLVDGEAEWLVNSLKTGKNSYDVSSVKDCNPLVAKAFIIKAFSAFSSVSLNREKINRIYSLLSANGRTQIAGNLFAEVNKTTLRFYAEDNAAEITDILVDSVPFEAKFYNVDINITEFSNYSKKVHFLLLDNLIDCDKIVGQLHFRNRMEGDSITLPKRKVSKSLKKLFIEAGIPREIRHKIPVLCDDTGVVWVYGFGVDKKYCVNAESTHIILVGGKDNDR